MRGSRVAVAWFTQGDNETPSVKLMESDDGGQTFAAPRIAAGNTSIGRVDVTILADGATLVLWVDSVDKAAEIRVRRYAPLDSSSQTVTVARIAKARSSGFPRMEAMDNTALVAWTGDDRRVHTAIVEVK